MQPDLGELFRETAREARTTPDVDGLWRRGRQRRARRRVAAALAAIVGLGGTAGLAYSVSTRPEPPLLGEGPSGEADVLGALALPRPGPLAAAAGSVWAVSRGTADYQRIDAATGAVLETYALSGDPVIPACAVWAADDTVVIVRCGEVDDRAWGSLDVIDASDGTLRTFLFPTPDVNAATIVDDAVWTVAPTAAGAVLERHDAHDGESVARYPLEAVIPHALANGFGSVWLTVTDAAGTGQPEGRLLRIDPDDGRVIASTVIVEAGPATTQPARPSWVVADAAAVWVAVSGAQQVVRVDPESNEVTHRVAVGGASDRVGSPFLATDGDGVWVRPTTRRLLRLGGADGEITQDLEVPAGGDNAPLVVTDGTAWLADNLGERLLQIRLPGS